MPEKNNSQGKKYSGPRRLDEERRALYKRAGDVAPRRRARDVQPKERTKYKGWEFDGDREDQKPTPPERRKRRRYRMLALTFGIIFFIVSVSVASFFLVFGNQTVSGKNILIDIEGPFAVAGGDEVPFTVTVTNQNPVPIISGNLTVTLPEGSEFDGDRSRERVVRNYTLNTIKSGDSYEVKLDPRLFGEENEEKSIDVHIEYRVEGSNALYSRAADPYIVTISSSPLVIALDGVTSITSGQDYELTMQVTSNASDPLEGVIVEVSYPSGFNYTSSNPEPVSGRNTWRFDSLEPGESREIVLKGRLSGDEDTIRAIDVRAGIGSDRDALSLASVLATAEAEVRIEAPFLQAVLRVDDEDADSVVRPAGDTVSGEVRFTNTLDDIIRNAVIEVSFSGNALDDRGVQPVNGYYDARTHTITYDSAENTGLQTIPPGETRSLRFTVTPASNAVRTPEIKMQVNVQAERTTDVGASQSLAAADTFTIRYGSSLAGAAVHGSVIGPYPPQVDSTTTYVITLNVEAGGNNVTDAFYSATLPQYVSVGDLPDGVAYNETRRQLTWDVGDLSAFSYSTARVPLRITPTVADEGRVLLLLGQGSITATDSFTGESSTITTPALTTATPDDPEGGAVRP